MVIIWVFCGNVDRENCSFRCSAAAENIVRSMQSAVVVTVLSCTLMTADMLSSVIEKKAVTSDYTSGLNPP